MPTKKNLVATTSPTAQSIISNKNRGIGFWLLTTCAKLLLIGLFTLFIYIIYLDGKVTSRFEGKRWQLPVQVYGQVLKFSHGTVLDIPQLSEQLRLMGYQQVAKPEQPMQFARSNTRISIYLPEFTFVDGAQAAQQVTIVQAQQRVTELYVEQTAVTQIKIPPYLLARLVPDNNEDRILVPLQQVPEQLLDTLLLVEDREFYFHHGVAPIGILRAMLANIRAGRTVQGGSTLTQQLVKNMFLTRQKTISRKVNEALMALLLEYRYSKDQLLEAYINEVYLGQQYANGIYGFGLAAKFFFDKNIDQLSTAQMALLIGQIKGPSYYDPWRHPKRAKQRRDLILQLMFERQLISKHAYLAAINSALTIQHKKQRIHQPFPSYLQLVKNELRYLLPGQDRQSGVKVFTGFSIRAQHLLQQTIEQQLPQLEREHNTEQLQTAMLVTDIDSGQIRALVGGRDTDYAGFNRALSASRQIGSLIKPFVYLTALERYQQYNLATVLADRPLSIEEQGGGVWRPENYDQTYRQQVNLLDALVESRNVPTVNLGMALGLDSISAALPMLGFGRELKLRPSMLLGAINMTPIEINQVYLSLASNGAYHTQHAITAMVASNGELLWQANEQAEQRLSTNAAYLIDYALTQVTERGTAKSLSWRLPEHVLAGKTGTTNNLRDSWFVGYDQQHLVTTWLGRDDEQPTKLTGSSGALVLFAEFMNKNGVWDKQLIMPEGLAMTTFELATGNAVTEDCRNVRQFPAVQAGILLEDNCQQKRQLPKQRSWLERWFGS
jgi:penicillin-binding protein 1B